MADKAITDLNVVPGSIDDNNTWFAVAQSGAAYKVSGHEFILAMSVIWQSHGGIRDIVYTDPVPPSLTGTLIITLADDTIVSFDVENGKGITSIAKTGTVGLVDTYTITYNDGTTSTFNVTNGAKGDTGDAWYVWIRYAGEEPIQDSDIGTTPDNWMGIYSGTSSTAPVHYTDYDWFEIKGEKGDTGTAATLVSNDIQYQQSDSGSVVPSGSWSATVPAPVAGKYLWTRTVLTFNSGSPVTFYSVARYGIDGTGAVSSVNSVSPDGNGNVALTADDIPTAGGISVEADLNAQRNTLTQLGNDLDTAEGDITALDGRLDTAEDDIDDLQAATAQLDQNIAYVESGNTASRTYTKGQFISWNGTLYTASAAIPLGDPFAVGTNLTAVVDGNGDLCGGLNALKTLISKMIVPGNNITTLVSLTGSSTGRSDAFTLTEDSIVVVTAFSGAIIQVESNGSGIVGVYGPGTYTSISVPAFLKAGYYTVSYQAPNADSVGVVKRMY